MSFKSHQERSDGRKFHHVLISSGPYIPKDGFKLTHSATPEKPGKRRRERKREKMKKERTTNPNKLTTQGIATARREQRRPRSCVKLYRCRVNKKGDKTNGVRASALTETHQ
mmetsp:Transcript_2148/g.4722  ORF Transcript_2148/g.4722 Transcript_2148/m.4722 type:complete len:112 (+) Transcript_2148:299-634(+)